MTNHTGLVIDLFAGGGGASVALEAALGRRVDLAINHDPVALAVHLANHQRTRHLTADIWDVRPLDATEGRPVQVLWASPDCFPAGTMILTAKGYLPIESIRSGDLVLTHQGRWRPITQIFRTTKSLLNIRGHGHPGLRVSGEHPFFARLRIQRWNNARRRYDVQMTSPTWIDANKLRRGYYWASPCRFPKLPIPQVGGRGMSLDARLMWLAGRYLGDGWSRLTETRAELVLICGKHEATNLRTMLARWQRKGLRAGSDELGWSEREVRTAHQFSTSHQGLVSWLRTEFGHGAAQKRIPGWALGMNSDLRQALLDGYLSADGHHARATQEANTVSPGLAFGIKALAGSLGKTVSIFRATRGNIIEGRKLKVRPIYSVRWRHTTDPRHAQVHRDNEVEWCPIREVAATGETAPVFNLSVAEDESYVAEGIIVHNCTHFSVAKGDVPRDHGIRSLAWVVVKWAKAVRPQVIFLENVREFQGWGPLGEDGRPDKSRMGETFHRWKRALERLGYVVDYRVLDASLYGAPTRRRRLFLVARCDGQPIVWPEPTHGPGRKPVHTAAECIDWSLPCPSIFDRKRPLAEKTLWRIAQGIRRFVLENPQPFIVRYNGGLWRGQGIEEPLTTQDTSNRFALVTPSIVEMNPSNAPHGVDDPLGTITTQHNRFNLVAPTIVKVNHGRLEARSEAIDAPLTTVTATQRGHALVMPTLVQTGYGERPGQRPRYLDIHVPLGTIIAGGSGGNGKHALVAAFLAKHFGGVVGQPIATPASTITARDHHSLTAIRLVKFRGTDPRQQAAAAVTEPPPTISAGGIHVAEVRAFLTAYYGSDGTAGQSPSDPLRTITAKHRLGLVTVEGADYQITDIGMRMLEPHELLRAQFGEHANTYDLTAAPTKAAKIRLIGNSVCPECARALIEANVSPAMKKEAVA